MGKGLDDAIKSSANIDTLDLKGNVPPGGSERSNLMSLRDRIGIDVGRRLRLEDALEWAAEHEVRWIDIQLDAGANALSSFDDARAAGLRR